MKTTTLARKNLFNWLLAVNVVMAFLFSLAFPTGSVQASPPGASYIIVFRNTVNLAVEASGMAQAYGLQPGFIYQHALKGMSALVPEGRLEALKHDPRVAYVSEDIVQSIDVQSMPTGIQRIFADTNAGIAINGVDDYRVDVAVIDTGVDFQHPDFNVVGGVNCYSW